MAEAVEFVRHLNRKIPHIVAEEIVPGPHETGAALRKFIRDKAWGHHASCSNAMGRVGDTNAVVDSRFRVIGTERLRVVDASVFPNIPGFFISAAIYMIAEKAADTIIADAKQGLCPCACDGRQPAQDGDEVQVSESVSESTVAASASV
jgi:choline dehydrogenase